MMRFSSPPFAVPALLAAAMCLPQIANANGNAPPAPEQRQASIPFANHGGIRNWHVTDRKTLYIQDIHNRWYKAELFGPCIDLPFRETLGFKTNADGSFDRFSSVYTRQGQCHLTSLTPTEPPFKHEDEAKKQK